MSITDELRMYVQDWRDTPSLMDDLDRGDVDGILEDFIRIADRIDAEHEAACAEAYGNGVMSVPIALDESQWVKLPVDADGKVIHVGDTIEIEHNGRVTTVTNINYNEYGWQVYCSEGGGFDKDTRCRHIKPDSWERIIEDACDMASRCCDDDAGKAELVERCRRLAGEDA